MSRVLNLDTKEAEWLAEISRLKKEIEKYERWITTAREMAGVETVTRRRTTLPNNSELVLPSMGGLGTLKIPEAVNRVISESKNKRLTATEITHKLLAGGFKTQSNNFRNVIQNRLHSLARDRRIHVEKEGNENYYSVLTRKAIAPEK
jgi:hypothetical protein